MDDGKANLPLPPSPSSSQEFLRQAQAALKYHRPLVSSSGTMQSNIMRPKRCLIPQRKVMNKSEDVVPVSQGPSDNDSLTDTFGEGCDDAPEAIMRGKDKAFVPSLQVESQNVDVQKKVQFSIGSDNAKQEMEWLASSQPEPSVGLFDRDSKRQNIHQVETEVSLISEGGKSSILPKRSIVTQDHLQQFKNFLSQPATQSSVVGPSCATTTSVHSTSAPMLSSTTGYSYSHVDNSSNVAAELLGKLNVNRHPITEGVIKAPNNSLKDINRMSIDQVASAVQASNSLIDADLAFKESNPSKEQQGCMPKETGIAKCSSFHDNMETKGKESADVTNIQSQAPISSSDVKLESSKLEKREKAASSKASTAARKRTYDPDSFFNVNGKLYQRLGKIGSGGSSEVHKVISSDCTIYALKRIKLKGRDYATAYGFCQEIEYLNRLKGKNNIIQLIDYEVTDKALLAGVMNGSFNNKDGRVKDDGYIYMVLEYGEIDLAHMLSQKWKELNGYNQTLDQNWLRFYWQQILQAVNTIHEERIVHSDLKPANFLLVKGSLKLIDFGIAKAIMSDTTNIQRDSQVGTLSYMSPEAFLCNETDANGNIIKCGRSSDIWSLGCILYQMVYGRTPFSDYKTFWAKFKVITDPNHEIIYEPVSNPWLVDLMKRCLVWDRNKRWRIPQLLQHPFLVPPVPCDPSLSQVHSFKLLQLIAETCTYDPEALQLCCQLQQVLGNPLKLIDPPLSLNSRDQQCKLLSRISELCVHLQERLTNTDK